MGRLQEETIEREFGKRENTEGMRVRKLKQRGKEGKKAWMRENS